MSIIETTDLTKFYGKTKGIERVSFCVDKGDFFGIIGPNGAGKSTLIRTLLGLVFPTSGNARIFGLDFSEKKREILSRIGYLPSEISFYKGMRVKEVLEFSARLRGRDCRQEAEILCDRLKLDPDRKVSELSFGNRKKVGIVCALQSKPELYVFDEPTSGLDPLMQKEFFTILEERNREGATVVLSSHVLSEVERYCRSAAIIRSGSILFSDRVENMKNKDVKKVSLCGVKALPAWEEVKSPKEQNGKLSFLYCGSSASLAKKLSELEMDDFTVTDPDMEEIFLHYYQKEAE